MSEEGKILRSIGSIEATITGLQKNYQVLNDNHMMLETKMSDLNTRFTVLEVNIKFACSILKWIVSPSMVIILLLQLASAAGITK